MNTKRRRVIKMGAISYAAMVKLLMEGVYTNREIAEQTGLHYVTVCQYTRELHRARVIHICDWEQDVRDRDSVKIYKLGVGKDKPRRRLSASERQRRHRESKRVHITSVLVLGATPQGMRGAGGAALAAGEAPELPRGRRVSPGSGRAQVSGGGDAAPMGTQGRQTPRT